MEKINLFCLPFAGGNKYSYRIFKDLAPSCLNLISLEYPGRGSRIKEPLMAEINSLVRDAYEQVKDTLGAADYALYGHSMGGIAAYLLAQKISDAGHRPPMHLFLTGTGAPSASCREEKRRYLMNKADFLEEIRLLEGCPEEILQNEELLDFFEPVLRADFQASETYFHEEHAPLDIPFTVITGTAEDLSKEDIRLWQKECNQQIDFRRMPGGHFFIYEHAWEILQLMTKKLFNYSKP